MTRIDLIKRNPKLLYVLTDLTIEELKEASLLKEFKEYKGDIKEFIEKGGNLINKPEYLIEYPEQISILYLYSNLIERYGDIQIIINRIPYNLSKRIKELENKIFNAIKENLLKEKEEDILIYLKNKPEIIHFLELDEKLFTKIRENLPEKIVLKILKLVKKIPSNAMSFILKEEVYSLIFKIEGHLEEKENLVKQNAKLLEKAPADFLYYMLKKNIFLVEKFNIFNSWIRHCSIKDRLEILEKIIFHEIFNKKENIRLMENLFYGEERKYLYRLNLNYIRLFNEKEILEKKEEIEQLIIEGVSIGKQTLKFFVYKTRTENEEILKKALRIHPSYVYKIKNPSKELMDIANEKLEKRREVYLYIQNKDLTEQECFVFFKTKGIYKETLSETDIKKLNFVSLSKICDVNFDRVRTSEAFKNYLKERIIKETTVS